MVSDLEHDSILGPTVASAARLTRIPVLACGLIDVAAMTAALAVPPSGRRLVVLQAANSETGVLQPVGDVLALPRRPDQWLLCDATQAAGRVPVDAWALGADYVTLSGHKIGGPKGAGALVVREGAPFVPRVLGGGQERARRAGTENVAAIAGFGAAADVAAMHAAGADGVMARIATLRDRLEAVVAASTPAARILGGGAARLPNTAAIALPGRTSETLVAALDLEGVAIGAGSACSSGKVGRSRVLAAMGLDLATAAGTLRLSLGPSSTDDDIAAFAAAWNKVSGFAARAA